MSGLLKVLSRHLADTSLNSRDDGGLASGRGSSVFFPSGLLSVTAVCHSQLEKIEHNWHLAGKQLIDIWLHEVVKNWRENSVRSRKLYLRN